LHFSDETLIQEALGGSKIAFERLIQRYERLIYKVAWSYAGQHDNAMDISQEIFIKVYRKLDSYRGTGSWQGWLLRLAHREGLDWIRRNRRHLNQVELAPTAHPIQPPTQEISRLQKETRQTLLDQLSRLNPRQQLAVSLRYFERRSIREIADTLECNENVARNILFRGLQKIRNQMIPRLGDGHE
jgi:RNA polymerase sigma-70 factor, ECF subfamily